MKLLTPLAFLALMLTASAAEYPVAFLAHPKTTGYFRTQSVSEQNGPSIYYPGTDLMIAYPDGTEKVLVKGNVLDGPVIPFDAKSILYSRVHDGVSDIYRIVLETGEIIQLTDAATEHELPASVTWDDTPPYNTPPAVWNMSPCEVGDGSIVFTSNRACVKSPHEGYTAQQLYRMDGDGKNVEKNGHLNLGGVGHPTISRTGRIYWSTGESQGNRLGLGSCWSIWSSNPDGSDWQPELSAIPVSAFRSEAWHFQTETSDGSLAAGMYYDTRSPHGTVHVAPKFVPDPFGPPTQFHSPLIAENPWVWNGRDSATTRTIESPPSGQAFRHSYTRRGFYSIAPWATQFDAENDDTNGTKPGMISQPNAIPGNGILLTWTGDQGDAAMNLGLYAIPDIKVPAETPGAMVKVIDNPDRHEWSGKPLVPFQAIYGIEKPPVPVAPKSNLLPPGSPFAEVSTSSMSWIELVDRTGTKLKNVPLSEVEYVRIVAFNPTLAFRSQDFQQLKNGHENGASFGNFEGFSSSVNERMGYYSELIPLKKYRKADGTIHYGPNPPADAQVILDPEGKPDTSFKAIIPADQPWTFQALNAKGETVVMAETWHQLRPMESRFCGGCHTHWQKVGFGFDQCFASTPEYLVKKLEKIELVEYYRDIKPIDDRLTLGLGDRPWVNGPWAFSSDTWTVDDDPRLTDSEARLLRTWNDTGFMAAGLRADGKRVEAPYGPYADGVAPTLAIKLYQDKILIGTTDPQSGFKSLSVKADFEFAGTAAGEELASLFTAADSVYSASGTVPKDGTLTVESSDNQGNVARRVVTIRETDPAPDSDTEEIARLRAEIEALNQQMETLNTKLQEWKSWLETAPRN